MGKLGGPELLIILLLVVLLFGGKKLPDAARGLGRSLRIFKSEMKADEQEPNTDRLESKTDKPDDNTAL